MFDAAVGKALKEAKQPEKQSDLSKKIQADVKAKLEKAIQGTGADDSSQPNDPPVKKSTKPEATAADPPEDLAKAVSLPAGKTCQGTMQIRGTAYKLDQAVAYSAIMFDEKYTNVLLSSSEIPLDKLKAALRDGSGKDDNFSFFEPNVKISYNKEGKAKFINAYGDNSSMSASGPSVKGELVINNGRVIGRCTYTPDDKRNGVNVQFDVSLMVVP